MDFTGKVIVVTGGASGIGRAVVEVAAGRGASVAIIDRDAARAQEVADRTGARAYQADVSDAGHMVAGDRNDVFTAAVVGFIARLSNG